MKTSALFLAAGIVGWSSGLGIAQTTTALNSEATKMNTLASSQGDSKVVDKISSDFSSFLGADSKAVVTGLWNGTPITLTSTAPPSTGSTAATTNDTTIINSPTGTMGHGNVFISLAAGKATTRNDGHYWTHAAAVASSTHGRLGYDYRHDGNGNPDNNDNRTGRYFNDA
jgi:hypothetical protein